MPFFFLQQDYSALRSRLQELSLREAELKGQLLPPSKKVKTSSDAAHRSLLQELNTIAEQIELYTYYLRNAQVVTPAPLSSLRAGVGSVVRIRSENNDAVAWYEIGSAVFLEKRDAERDGKTPRTAFLVSCSSPIGRALLDKEPGDTTKLPLQKKVESVDIVEVIQPTVPPQESRQVA